MATIMMDPRALNKDKVAAADVAAKLDKSIDELVGVTTGDRVTTAALSEVLDAFTWMISQVNPEQKLLYMQLLQHLKQAQPLLE